VIASVGGDLGIEKVLVVGIFAADAVGPDKEDSLDTIGPLLALELELFLPQKVSRELDGADVEGGGVVGGAHGCKDSLDVGGVNVLGLVDD